ncbi:MAG TPA: NADH-quinone oxidoreductase subunit NuoN [Burkholderiales bacterium]|nr:NADH-quinone oxidoreductase subunit NuoN [Burkholderiales bacterium]
MNLPFPDLAPAMPEIFLLVMTCIVLVTDLFVGERRNITYGLSVGTLVACALLIGLLSAIPSPTYTFNHMFVLDLMSSVLKGFTCIAAAAALVYSRGYLEERGLLQGEYFSLTLFATLGMMVLISASHFLTIYLGLELLSLSLYAMIALNRDSATSTEAAMKYFVLGALASGLLLYGMSMIYGATGTLDLSDVALGAGSILQVDDAKRDVLIFGLVFVVSGVAFKLGVVPYHMWVPDVYQGSPNAVTLFIGTAPELAAFAMAMRLLVNGLLPLAIDWQQMLLLLAVLSIVLGNLAAIAQTNIKRMLAYSTISHMGFLLLGLVSGVVGETWRDANWLSAPDAYGASMFYVIVYVVTTLAAFGVVLLLSRAGFEADNIEDYRGLNRRSPWFAFIMLVAMFSLAGVPPAAGFYAKLVVLQAAVAAGQVWLAVVAVVFSLIGAFYYLRIVKLMYFEDPVDAAPLAPRADMRVLLTVNGVAVLALGILPQQLMQLCYTAIKSL